MKRLFYALLVACIAVTTISSCKKPKNTITPPPAGSLILYNNVHIVDTSQWILQRYGGGNGAYYFSFTPTTPNIDVNVGDIIVGITNGGYIRKVTAVSISGPFLELQTSEATMADVFASGTFTLQVPLNAPNQSGPGITTRKSNFGLWNNGYTVDLNASLNVQPNFTMIFAFDSGLTSMKMSTTNTVASDSVGIVIQGANEPYVWNKDTLISSTTINTIQWVTAYGNIKVPIVMSFAVAFGINAKGGSANYGAVDVSSVSTWVSNYTFSGGLQYTSNQWQPVDGINANNNISISDSSNNGSTNTQIALLTYINSVFYNMAGPQISVGISGIICGTNRFPPGFSDSTSFYNVESDVQPNATPFGHNTGTFSQSWSSDTVFYKNPYKLFLISGNNQTGNVATVLPEPLVIKLTDSKGNPVIGYTVTFTITGGGGFFGTGTSGPTSITTVTDMNGSAQVDDWKMGANQNANQQIVTVTAVDGSRISFNGSPGVFTATAN